MTISRSDLCWLALPLLLGGCREEGVSVPSGRELSLIEIVTNAPGTEGAAARFRFLAPGLAPEESEEAAGDMQALCDTFAHPRIDGMVPAPQQIIISWSGEAVPFGEAAPDVVQFFESYRVDNSACIWEPF